MYNLSDVSKEKKDIPVLFANKAECCGCTACYSVCPKNAIKMKADEEGFLYPLIDKEKCVCCQKCTKVCPLKNIKLLKKKMIE